MKFLSDKLSNSNTAVVMLISCILCIITMSLSDLCPEDTRITCNNVASGLNCILCLIVIAHFFGAFKK